MEIRTERLLLREIQEADFEPIARYEADPDFKRHQLWSQRTPSASRKFVTLARAHIPIDPRRYYALALVPFEADELIGVCTLAIYPEHPSQVNECGVQPTLRAELGWGIDKRFWGRGYATEASHELVKLAFETLKVERITGDCCASNIASRRVMEKLGLRFVKSYRHRGWHKASFQFLLNPAVHYELKRSDWHPREPQLGGAAD